MNIANITRPFAFLVFVALACSAPTSTADRDPRASSSTAMRVMDCEGPARSLADSLVIKNLGPSHLRTVDDLWTDIARTTPGGFAGLTSYPDGHRILMLTSPRDSAAAKAALVPLFPGVDVKGAVVQQARWTFAQLAEWYYYLISIPSPRNAHITLTGIGRVDNRIDYGVADEAGREVLVEQLKTLNLPCDLMLIDIVPSGMLLDRNQ